MINMKKNIVFITTIILFSFFYSCDFEISQSEGVDYFYIKGFNTIDTNFLKHFPKKQPEGFMQGLYSAKVDLVDSCFSPINYIVVSNYNKAKYDSIYSGFKSKSIIKLQANDTNVLLIFSYCDVMVGTDGVFKNLESKKNKYLAHHNISLKDKIPIPLFDIDQFKSNTFSGLPEDFRIYVLEAKPGKYLEDKYLRDCVCLPKKWKHGFSRGVAMSDKRHVIIYWVTVW